MKLLAHSAMLSPQSVSEDHSDERGHGAAGWVWKHGRPSQQAAKNNSEEQKLVFHANCHGSEFLPVSPILQPEPKRAALVPVLVVTSIMGWLTALILVVLR